MTASTKKLMSSEKISVFKRFLQNKDRNAIVICVFIAFVFWLTNALSEDYSHEYEFELECEYEYEYRWEYKFEDVYE